jgi:hypothetical protein
VLSLLLAASLAAAPLSTEGASPGAVPDLRLQEEWESPGWDEDDEAPPRVRLTAWGGEALGDGGSGRGSGFAGGEAGWAFDSLDLSVSGAGYRNLDDADRTWTPVVLARFTQRFRMRRDVEAAFGFGLGAGRPKGWTAWYQVAIGVRVPLGPLFLAGELAFEQNDLLRLGAGLGVSVF